MRLDPLKTKKLPPHHPPPPCSRRTMLFLLLPSRKKGSMFSTDNIVHMYTQTCVPYLCLDSLPINLDASCGKLHANRRLGLEVELVACEPREEIGFTHSRITY